jgi:hypothetical protein
MLSLERENKMVDGLLEQATPAASGAETISMTERSSRTVPAPGKRQHLTLRDWNQSEQPVKAASKPTRRRPLLSLFDIAVLVLIIVSTAAAMTCLIRMA